MYSFVLLVHCVHLPWQLEIPMGCPSSTQIYVLALLCSGEGMDFVQWGTIHLRSAFLEQFLAISFMYSEIPAMEAHH